MHGYQQPHMAAYQSPQGMAYHVRPPVSVQTPIIQTPQYGEAQARFQVFPLAYGNLHPLQQTQPVQPP